MPISLYCPLGKLKEMSSNKSPVLGKQRHLLLSEMLSKKKRGKYPLKFTISGRFKHGFMYILYYKTILSYLIWKVKGLQEKVAMHNKSFLLYLVV